MPTRIQRSRAKGWRMPNNAVYVGRPTVFGNPFTVAGAIADDPGLTMAQASTRCVRYYRAWLDGKLHPAGAEWRQAVLDKLHRLAGMDLACWCPIGQPCHADVLINLAAEAGRDIAEARTKARGWLL